MNHDKARERSADGVPTGLWHYTSRNDRDPPGAAHPIGYCGPYRTCPDCGGFPTVPFGFTAPEAERGDHCARCGGRGVYQIPEAERCPGHATPAEAEGHYKEYLLDSARYLGPKKDAWPKEKCAAAACEQEATHLMTIPGSMRHYEVCAAHHNRETLDTLVSVGESWHS